MNIAIVTVYQPFTNLGSFLQAFALKRFLETHGHKAVFVKTGPHFKSALKLISHLRPYRSYLMRIGKAFHALCDLNYLSFIASNDQSIDCYIYGSDEIWNVTNKFFCRPIFFGIGINNKPKIGYAVSAGHAETHDFSANNYLTKGISGLNRIFTRDIHTQSLIKECYDIDTDIVADPTLLVELEELSSPVRLPRFKYLLAYTYGIDPDTINILRAFARKNNLKIVSPCFWHIWADKTIECSALQFSTLMANAEYVFTTTFHGAIFALRNHTRCAILPLRPKVKSLCYALGSEARLLSSGCDLNEFENIISKPFPNEEFEENLDQLRSRSMDLLISELEKIKQ